MSRVRSLAFGLVLLAPLAALATEAPHDASSSPAIQAANCKDCHVMHAALGGYLAPTQGNNANNCNSCHGSVANSTHGFGWSDVDQAVPGSGGKSHSWTAAVTNLGCTNPGVPMSEHLESGNLACSVCHDQHNNLNGRQAGTWQHVSYPVGVPQYAVGQVSGPQLTVVSPVAAGAAAKGYLIDIVVGGAVGTATYRLSNDGGTNWLYCTAATTYVYTGSTPCQTGSNLSLNDGTNVKVTFTGTTAVGNQWKFYVGYPFYRIASPEGEMCVACHKDRNMASTATANGTLVMSHPVGAAFTSNERAPNLILDANGASTQTGAGSDGIATNNLRVTPSSKVFCLSCHSMHNSDSNALSSDPR